MKELLCKFANWILRRCLDPMTPYGSDIFINGRAYLLRKTETEFSRHPYTVITFEVVDGNPKWRGVRYVVNSVNC